MCPLAYCQTASGTSTSCWTTKGERGKSPQVSMASPRKTDLIHKRQTYQDIWISQNAVWPLSESEGQIKVFIIMKYFAPFQRASQSAVSWTFWSQQRWTRRRLGALQVILLQRLLYQLSSPWMLRVTLCFGLASTCDMCANSIRFWRWKVGLNDFWTFGISAIMNNPGWKSNFSQKAE